MDEQFERAPVGILEVDPSGTIRSVNERAGELLDVEPTEAADSSIETVFPASVEAGVPQAFEGPPETEQSLEEFYPDLDCWFAVTLVPVEAGVFVYLTSSHG